jgi:hypothetical protein
MTEVKKEIKKKSFLDKLAEGGVSKKLAIDNKKFKETIDAFKNRKAFNNKKGK